MKIMVSGASGLVGAELASALRARGHELALLSRSGAGVSWDPEAGELEAGKLEGLDAVVHLAGENIASGRWSARKKAAIRDSRVLGTRLLADRLAKLERGPRVLVCASAVGYYGDGDREVDEESASGKGFLAEVCRDWELAAKAAEASGVRVVSLRIGVVLSAEGGALGKMLLPFRLGLGGPVGNGGQWMSWIAISDLVDVIAYALSTGGLSGPVNAVAPGAVTNADFAGTLGRVLGRPAFLPLPGFAVRAFFGEMGEELLLQGQRVRPSRLLQAGFRFRHPDLEPALRHLLLH
ncbi:TIGR01777 family oxidoreductase [Elusimicrobiota bacterium]